MTSAQYGALFDMDGVLVDSHDAHYESWARLGEEIGQPFSKTLFSETFGTMNAPIIRKWLGEETNDEEIAKLSDRKEILYRAVACEALRPLDHVCELIGDLRAHGFRLAVGSSGPRENVELVLDSVLHLREAFDALVTMEDVTHGKPAPEVFLKAAAQLGLPAARCVVFEDAPQGVEAGRAAGALVVAITSTRSRRMLSAADLVVDSWGDVDVEKIMAMFAGRGVTG